MADVFYDIATVPQTGVSLPSQGVNHRVLARNHCGWLWSAWYDSDELTIKVVYSTNNGQTWTVDEAIVVPGGDPFAEVYALQFVFNHEDVPYLAFIQDSGAYIVKKYVGDQAFGNTGWSTASPTLMTDNVVNDNYSLSVAITEDSKIHAVVVKPGTGYRPKHILYYGSNESGEWQFSVLDDNVHGVTGNTVNDEYANPALCADRCGNLHLTFVFSTKMETQVVGEVTVTTIQDAYTQRWYGFRSYDSSGFSGWDIRDSLLQELRGFQTVPVVANAYRGYSTLIGSWGGSMALDSFDGTPHISYKFGTALVETFNPIYISYKNTITSLEHQFISLGSVPQTDAHFSNHPSVLIQATRTGTNSVIYVLFECSDFTGFGFANPTVIQIMSAMFLKATGWDSSYPLTDTAQPSRYPNTLHGNIPYFLAEPSIMSLQFCFTFVQSQPSGDPKYRIGFRNAFAFQVPTLKPFDLAPCIETEPNRTSFVLAGEGASESTYPLVPDFPFRVVERFETSQSEMHSRHVVTHPRLSSTRRAFTIIHRNISRTTLDSILAFFDARDGAKAAFTFAVPNEAENVKVHLVNDSLQYAKSAPDIYSITFVFEELY